MTGGVKKFPKPFPTSSAPPDPLRTSIDQLIRLTPRGIIETLNLRRPIYRETAQHGHFGRELPAFSWERTDKAEALRREAGLVAVA